MATDNTTTNQIWQHRLLQLDYLPAGELARRFNLLNPRLHPEAQKDATETSLEKVQWIDEVSLSTNGDGPPSLADNPDAVLFDGHERVEIVLARFGPDALVPVKWYRLNKEETDFALLVKDQTTGMAEYIPERLAELMERTRAMTADSRLAGMLERLREKAGVNGKGPPPEPMPPPIDKAAELQEVWQVQPGQIWQAGTHFIICGDCREAETWKRLLSAAEVDKVNGVFTSPPYAEQRKAQYGGVPTDKYVEWWEAVQGNVRANLAGDGSFFVNIKASTTPDWFERELYVYDLVIAMKRKWDWFFIDEFCWERSGIPGQVTYRFKNGFESIFHFVGINKPFKIRPENTTHLSQNVPIPGGVGIGHVWGLNEVAGTGKSIFGTDKTRPGEALPNNVLRIFDSNPNLGHAAAFPVALPSFFLKAYSDPGDVWLDPFCGSGTTLVACENEKRVGLGIEKLEKYCAVILERLKTNGLTPTLVSQGA